MGRRLGEFVCTMVDEEKNYWWTYLRPRSAQVQCGADFQFLKIMRARAQAGNFEYLLEGSRIYPVLVDVEISVVMIDIISVP